MAGEGENDTTVEMTGRRRSFWRKRLVYPLLLILGLAFVAFWLQRDTFAGNVIGRYLRSHNVHATYRIDRIGGAREVLSHIVIGDPRKPDLTIERAEVVIRYRLGLPGISRIVLVRPRLYGTYIGGKLSFGEVDRLLATTKKQPFALPDYALDLTDGRALLETDYGPVGIKADGKGNLSGGFAGVVAATAPKLALAGCALSGATAYGKLTVASKQPAFEGPLRLRSLDCGPGRVRLANANLEARLGLGTDLASVQAKLAGDVRGARFADAVANAVRLTSEIGYRQGELTADYNLTGEGLSHPQAQLSRLTASGSVRAGKGFGWVRAESDFSGEGFRPGAALDRSLAQMAEGAGDSLLGAVLRQWRAALLREATGSRFSGQASLRKIGGAVSLVVPQASVVGGSGESVLSLSRFQYGGGSGGLPRLSGNFATGGRGLPRIEGRITQSGNDGFTAQLAMADYAVPGGSLAVPSLAIVSRGERIGFAGRAILSGALPGGRVEGLLLPVSGYWSSAAGLALWRQCTRLTFDSLRYADLTLQRHGLTVCPAKGQPVVRYDGRGLRIAAGVPSLDLTGSLGATPIAIRSGPIGFAYPGTVSARSLLVTLGPRQTASTFAVSNLTAHVGKTIAGRFGGTEVRLASAPMDIVEAQGAWDYANGRFAVSDGSFRLVDRQQPARFEPLAARGATLALKDNLVTAEATLREPKTDAAVTRVVLRHDLATARGHADLFVDGLTFGPKLQPESLTPLALGVVANVAGTVRGTGQIDWDARGVTSHGKFSTDSLDFAAEFGPVSGASGTIDFTDLINMTTAPNQMLKVASINPGIEVTGGEISYQLRNGTDLTVNSATWPFMGGTLTMRPASLDLSGHSQRSFVLEIRGLEAAQFVDRMQLENLSATGTFDGEIPLVFDLAGNGRIDGGHLASRGGGNVSYVGALTYKDLTPMANVAFKALRSLDYQQMNITMDGPLTGEIVTRVRFDGVSQGVGTKQNFITREIGKLPFRFIVTVTAPFYKLITNIKAMYDPTMVRNPQDLAAQGLLIDENGNAISADRLPAIPAAPATPAAPKPKPTPDEANIQRRESESKP